MSKKVKRLFETFQPEHYQLHLTLDKTGMTFAGRVVITGHKIGRPSKRLTFHQKGLKVTGARLLHHHKSGPQSLNVERINAHHSLDEVRVHGPELFYPGKYEVELTFRGQITKAMVGIYPCYYKYNSQEKIILATQFESHHAREVFPCIDEPEAKATFDLTLTTDKGETVLSNTPIKSQSSSSNQTITSFETTPKMSTYLLAFVTGELHYVERTSKAGVQVRSYASVAQPKSHLEYSVNEAANILDFFSDYFGMPYPLAKCDQVALPDFDSAAMENWGLITFREVVMLADPKNRSVSAEQLLSLVISHELSHQWFGNLVTMKWWDDLWLNESFANFMEYIGVEAIHPDWQ